MTSDYSASEAALLTELRSRGHWEVVIRPQPFKQRVADSKELLHIIEKSAIDLGWEATSSFNVGLLEDDRIPVPGATVIVRRCG